MGNGIRLSRMIGKSNGVRFDKQAAGPASDVRVSICHRCDGDLVRQFHRGTRAYRQHPAHQPRLLAVGGCSNGVFALCFKAVDCPVGDLQEKYLLPLRYIPAGYHPI